MFIFRFEKLLSIKENLLKKCMIEIATIDAVIETYARKKMELELERSQRMEALDREITSESINPSRVMFIQENLNSIQEKIDWLSESIENLKRQKQEKIEEAKKLNTEKKKLEKLKERAFQEYTINRKRKEMALLDEIASIKTARNNIEY